MAVLPAETSRFAQERWIRQLVNGVEIQWRPYRLRRRRMPDSMDPVKVVKPDDGTSLWALAARYYSGVTRPEGYWWLIADANDIVDPTLTIAGKDVSIPPLTLLEVALDKLPTEASE